MNSAPRQNPIMLRSGMAIGSLAAETDDEFLFSCFVTHTAVAKCTNFLSPGMIVLGSTGIGKTAILRHIEEQKEYYTQLDPLEMAMTYVANSDVLAFLNAIGADIDLLFQILWKHVLCIEFIRMRWEVKSEDTSHKIFARFREKFKSDSRKIKALDYLNEWAGRFWITTEQSVKEIIEKYEKNISTEMGAEIKSFKANRQYEKNLSGETKSELVSRVRKIIDSNQLSGLSGIIDMLAEGEADDSMKKFYILIDKLDEKWVDDSIRFRLIRALIETLKTFRRIPNLKVLVALRADILERTLTETKDHIFQREKFEDYFVRLKWTKLQLRELVERRISYLFKHRYTTENIGFSSIFNARIHKHDPFDYIVDRTLLRPRDIILFINHCLDNAEGSYQISAHVIQKAEAHYSQGRKQALEDEWRSIFPSLNKIIQFTAEACEVETSSRRKDVIDFTTFCVKERVEQLALEMLVENIQPDILITEADKVLTLQSEDFMYFAKHIISVLYRVGAIGLKLRPGENYIYSHIDSPLIEPVQIYPDTKLRIHPMLHAALRVEMP